MRGFSFEQVVERTGSGSLKGAYAPEAVREADWVKPGGGGCHLRPLPVHGGPISTKVKSLFTFLISLWSGTAYDKWEKKTFCQEVTKWKILKMQRFG